MVSDDYSHLAKFHQLKHQVICDEDQTTFRYLDTQLGSCFGRKQQCLPKSERQRFEVSSLSFIFNF